jgi:hypothetical protein
MAHEKLYSVQYSRSLGDVALGYMKAAKRRVAAARTAH